jgi:hypothetical protein
LYLLAAVAITTVVVVIYAGAASSYFFNDDFHWLAQTQVFQPAHMVDLSRYDHFYRPVIEVYFYAGLSMFGCDAFPFHAASIALHLMTTLALFVLARQLAGPGFAVLSSAFFAVQPGYSDAVTWIGAIVDLLPALWYLIALAAHVAFLRDEQSAEGRGQRAVKKGWYYAVALGSFVLCHLTHESSATLLPMMLATEFTFVATGGFQERLVSLRKHVSVYLPFLVILAGYLALSYVVNSRSYLVRDGHYAFGIHAVTNTLNYIISLYVGRRAPVDYTLVLLALGALLWRGAPRTRFFVLWIVVTLAPVSFFTWGNTSRYLYLPAAGFAMLVADMMLAGQGMMGRWMNRPAARAVMVAVALALAVRFGVFAKRAADSFPERTRAYERLVAEVRRTGARAAAGETVYVNARFVDGVPDTYRDAAASIGLCLPGIRLGLR